MTKPCNAPRSVATLTDELLMAGIRASDEAALALLIQRHTPMIRSILRRFLNNDADTDEVLQRVFSEVWDLAEYFKSDRGSPLGLMHTLARRRAIDRVRSRQAYQRAEQRLSLTTQWLTGNGVCRTTEHANRKGLEGIFRRSFGDLSPTQAQALHLHYYDHLTQREIAAKIGIPLGTVKTRLELGLRKVAQSIDALGHREDWL